MKLRVIAFVVACAACTKGSSSADAGASQSNASQTSASTPVTRAALFTGLAAAPGASCGKAGVGVNVGGIGASGPLVANGQEEKGAPVTVQCRIAPKPGGYDMSATIVVAGVGSLRMQAALDGSGSSTAGAISLTRGEDGTWASTQCTLNPSGAGPGGGVGPGRYWAAIACPSAVNPGKEACAVHGAIRIENCVAQ